MKMNFNGKATYFCDWCLDNITWIKDAPKDNLCYECQDLKKHHERIEARRLRGGRRCRVCKIQLASHKYFYCPRHSKHHMGDSGILNFSNEPILKPRTTRKIQQEED